MIFLNGINASRTTLVINTVRILLTLIISFLLISSFGITGVGVGLLIGEFFGAFILPFYYCMKELKLPIKEGLGKVIFFGTLQIVLLTISYLYTHLANFNFILFFFDLCIMIIFSLYQFRNLDIEVQDRFIKLFLKIGFKRLSRNFL